MRRFFFLLLVVAGLGLWAWDAAAESAQPLRVIVSFRQAPGASEATLVRNLGGLVRHTYHLLPAMAVELPPSALASLGRAPGVALVEEDRIVELADAELDNSWGVKRIGAGEVHPFNRGQGIKVAVLDTGLDYGHPDLNDNYAGGYDFVNGDSYPLDDHGHGTVVAGVIAAEDNNSGVVGVVPQARLYALKVLDHTGTGYTSDIIAALEWAVNQGIDVVNMSFGSPYYSWNLDTAIGNAYQAGVTLVAAAGNEGTCDGAGDTVSYPARFDEVIAVAATDQSDVRPCWSSTGPAVELAAPGVYVKTTYPGGGYAWGSGTSLASPHVAGAAALGLASQIADSNGNGKVNDELRLRLQQTAEDLGTVGRDSWYGFGLVNVRGLAPSSADSDEDGFTDAAENYMGTDPLDSCPNSPEHDAWPPDTNRDTYVNIMDVLLVKPVMGSQAGQPSYNPRFDLNTDGKVDLFDILLYKPFFWMHCL